MKVESSTGRRWWLVSDLHLDVGCGDARGTADAFAEFLRSRVLPGAAGEAVVLLGDTLEVAGLSVDGSVARLDALAASHPQVFGALRECVAHGVQVHVVAGNHDVDLARPAVSQRLRDLLADPYGRSVVVHPWALHLPGLFFAEHGHQHHSVHRLPTLLFASVDDAVRLPTPALVTWHTRGSAPARLVRTARALLATRAAEGQALRPAHAALLDAEAARLSLSPGAARALWQQSRFRLGRTVGVTAGRLARQRLGRPLHANTAQRHAEGVTRELSRHGSPVRWYVSGHTHRAGAQVVPDGATCFNSGTWCSDIRGGGPDATDPRRFPYVVVDDVSEPARAGIGYWQRDSRTG